jgi:hypothetical protein
MTPALSDAAMTFDSVVLDAIASTSIQTGLRAGPGSELLVRAIREAVFMLPVAWAALELAKGAMGEA